jgi:hypothetical protein
MVMSMRYAAFLCCLTAAAVLAACAGGAPPVPGTISGVDSPQSTRGDAAAKRVHAAARFRFKIPHRKHVKGEHYVSNSTKSIAVIAFDSTHTHQLASNTINTVPGAGGCSAVSGGTFTCNFAVNVPAGNDTFDVNAYDATGGGGKKLSAASDFAFDVVAGKDNQIAMTLGGIPAFMDATLIGTSLFAHGSVAGGLRFAGSGPNAMQQIQLVAKDADQNIIVNPGAPTLAITGGDAKHLSIAPVSGSPGRFAITPLAQTGTPLAMTASATQTTGAPLDVPFTLQLDPVLYEISCWNTTAAEFAPWSTDPLLTITSSDGIFSNSAMAVDAAGNLYLANKASGTAGSIMEFTPGSAVPLRTITGLDTPTFLALDTSGDIFVTEQSKVEEFPPGTSNTVFKTMTSVDAPVGLAVDAAGNLYVANSSGTAGVSVFAPGKTATTPTFSFSAGMSTPQWLAFDTTGNLYVGNVGGQNVTSYAAPFSATSKVLNTYGSSSNINTLQAIAVDVHANVFVANSSSALEFNAAQNLIRTIPNSGIGGTNLVTTDQMGNVYLPYQSDSPPTISVYAPATMSPMLQYTGGLDGPMDVAVWP